MFYAQFVLSKKGPLAKIWLAAHWEKKLTKAQIYETDVDEACEEIIKPTQNIALRTTGHLLLGIVRIYSRKSKYLLADCNEAFLKIKLAFRPGQLDAPNEPDPLLNFQMPDYFGEIDNTLPEFNEADVNNTISQSRIDDITLKEDTGPDNYHLDLEYEVDDFGEHAAGIFGSTFDDLTSEAGSNFEFVREMSCADSLFGREREPTPCLDNAHAPGSAIFADEDIYGDDSGGGGDNSFDEPMQHDQIDTFSELGANDAITTMNDLDNDDNISVRSFQTNNTAVDRNGDFESYVERQDKRKKKRKLLIDENRCISGEDMKANMSDFRDTLNAHDVAPPTRKLMKMKSIGTAEKLFHMPGSYAFRSRPIIRQYQSRLGAIKNDMTAKNEAIARELGLVDIVEDDFNFPEPQDEPFHDDFEMVAAIDVDNMEMDDDVHIELSEQRSPSPLIPPIDVDEPVQTEKGSGGRKKKERVVEEDDNTADPDEDNRWSKRTQAVLNSISNKIKNSEDEEISINDLLNKNSTRKTAAQKFYTLLVLKKWQAIEVHQEEAYKDITITAGPNIAQTLGQQ